MRMSKNVLFFWVAGLLLLSSAASWAQEGKEGETGICNLSECLGIKWRTPDLAKLRKLDPQVPSVEGRLPIHYATASCSPPAALEILAEAGANFDPAEPLTGLTPLQISLRNCSYSTIRTLLHYGGDPNRVDVETGGNALHYAIAKNMPLNKIRLIVESNVNLNFKDDQGQPPLLQAMIKDNLDIVHMLLDAGADPNVFDQNQAGPVHYAAQKNDLDLLRKLRDLGADLDAVSKRGRTPLHIFAAKGITPEIVAVFKVAQADPDPADEVGATPLHYAAAQTSPESVAALVALGGRVNQADDIGDTPLHYAIRFNPEPKVVRALLRVGADPNNFTGVGEAPTILAIKHSQDMELLQLLLDYGANATTVDEQGSTLLHHAVLNRNSNIAASLLALGADPFEKDSLGRSAYELAGIVKIGEPALSIFEGKKKEQDALIAEQQARREKALAARKKELAEKSRLKLEAEAAKIPAKYDFNNEVAGDAKLKRLQKAIANSEKSLQKYEERDQKRKTEEFRKKLEDLKQQESQVASKLAEIRRKSAERRRVKVETEEADEAEEQ